MAELEPHEVEDFDAFWAEQDRRGLVLRNVFGVDVELPPELPLRFEIEARRLEHSKSEQDTRRMVGLLFGQDALDRWIERGMDLEQFGVLLLWGSVNASGSRISLTDARTEYKRREQEQEQQGKAQPPRRDRRKNGHRTRGGSSSRAGH